MSHFGDPVELTKLGVMDWGAPAPLLLTDEYSAALCWYLETAEAWDGRTIHRRNPVSDLGAMAFVKLDRLISMRTQPTEQPNHTFAPIAPLSHCVCEIRNSAWAAEAPFGPAIHLVFCFHDRVFEFLCGAYESSIVHSASLDMLDRMEAHVFGE